LQIAYVSDAEISIKGSTTKTKTYSHDKLGFNREDTKEWCTLIQILQSPDHFYHVGMSHGTESTRNKEYDAKRTILIVISRKLVSFLNDAYALRLPEKFQIFEIIKKEKPGTYGPKFTVPNLSTKFADYDGCKRETLIPLIEKLSSKLVILRKRGDEQSETDLIKITHKLEEAIGVALEKKWLGKNQAASYLNPSTED